MDEKILIQAFPEADVILLEGFKGSNYPKYVCNYPEEPIIEPEVLVERIIAGKKVSDEINGCSDIFQYH